MFTAFFVTNKHIINMKMKVNPLVLGGLGLGALYVINKSTSNNTNNPEFTNDNPPLEKKFKRNGLNLSASNPNIPTLTGGGGTGTNTTGTGTTGTGFDLSTIPVSTVANKYAPNLFPVTTYGTTSHSDLGGIELPKFMVTLQTDYSINIKEMGIDMNKLGIMGSVDWRIHSEEGTHWNRKEEEFYVNDINTRTGVNRNSWSTSLPFAKRLFGFGGDLSRATFEAMTTSQQAFNYGQGVGRTSEYGRIVINGQSEVSIFNTDWETNYENGERPEIGIPFVWGVCKSLKGLYQAMYIWQSFPDNSVNGYPVNGVIDPQYINPLFKLTANLNGETIDLKTLNNLAHGIEVSRYGEENFDNLYDDGFRVIQHFGTGKNTDHYLEKTISIAEKNYWYNRSIDNKFVFCQPKIICDRGSTGWQFANGSRPDGKAKQPFSLMLNRDKVLKSVIGCFMSGVHVHEWNRPDLTLNMVGDGMNGFLGALTVLGSKFNVGGVELSAVDLRDNNAYFPLWEVMFKMDNETNFKIIEGCNLDSSTDNILVRVMTNGKYIVVFACDAYNTASVHGFTVKHQTTNFKFEKAFTNDDWKSCYPRPAGDTTKRYDYVFGIYEMSVR
jgi:hypothetical protein